VPSSSPVPFSAGAPRRPSPLIKPRRRGILGSSSLHGTGTRGEQEQAQAVAGACTSSQPPRRPPPSANRVWQRESGGRDRSWPLLLPPHGQRRPGAASGDDGSGRHDGGRGGRRRPCLHRIKVSAAESRRRRRAWRQRQVRQGIRDDELAPSNRAPAPPSASPPSFLPLLHLCSRRIRRGRGASPWPRPSRARRIRRRRIRSKGGLLRRRWGGASSSMGPFPRGPPLPRRGGRRSKATELLLVIYARSHWAGGRMVSPPPGGWPPSA
jgi:hypothetical protein